MTHRIRIFRLALPALAALAFLGATPAHAVGRLADVNVIDRDSGATLPVYRHQGEYWVAGRPGARYAVSVRNACGERVLGVISVDGVNVVSGETASWEQTGYVLAPWQSTDIAGWRKSDAEVAAFHFTASQASYAARTGRPDNVGVIGVAVFREKLPPAPVAVPYSQPRALTDFNGAASDRSGSAAPGATAADKAAAAPAPNAGGALAENADAGSARSRDESLASGALARPAPAPRLGTGHGEREYSRVSHAAFERRASRPDELLRIRYDSRENLVAMGVIPGALALPPRPNPFPEAPLARYAPDPPAGR